MTKEEISSAKSLCEKATDGPWDGGPVHIEVKGPPLTKEQFVEWMSENANAGVDGPFWSVVQPATGLHTAIIGNGSTSAANAAFIAASRTLLPKALDALEEAHRKLDRVKALWEKWDEEADFAANEMDPRTAETLNRCVQQIGEILLGESTT